MKDHDSYKLATPPYLEPEPEGVCPRCEHVTDLDDNGLCGFCNDLAEDLASEPTFC